MSLEKRAEKKGGKTVVGRKPKLAPVGGKAPWDLVADIAESSTSLSEVADKAKEQFGLEKLTIPTVSAYLKKAWGDDYQRKKEDMSERRSNRRKWEQEFDLARQGIGDVFKKEYLSPNDGIYFNQETGEIETLPFIIELGRYWRETEEVDPDTGETVKKRQALPKKNVINFSKEGDFGWSEDPVDPDTLGTSEPTTQGMVLRQLIKRVEGLIDEKKKRYVKNAVDLELSRLDLTQITVEEIPKLHRDTTRRIRKESADELRSMDEEKVRMIGTLLNQLSRGDNRSKFTHGRDLFDEKIGPAYASSDKKWRGKQRMLALPDETFSRAVQNLPFVLYMHPKRLQVHSHNLSKKLPELLNPEEPVVKARFNDAEGINARVRFPRNQKEYVETMEAGMIVTEGFADSFKYFTVVEEGTLIAENVGSIPEAPRRHAKIHTYKDYEHFKDRVKSTRQVDRLDPITAGGFEEIGHGVGNRSARHSGELVLVGSPKRKTRKITLSQGAEGDEIINVEYWAQDYQIVRQDKLRVGDKLLCRGGLKGIVSDIVPKMGKDAKGRPYDLIANYDEVWREADRSTAEGKIKDDTFYKQGKKKSAIVLEHEAGDGQIFFFMIDKFAQDSTTTGLSFSPTLVSGLWERALDQLPANATEKQRDDIVEHFAERYFRGEGNFVSTLKSLHYKAVKKDGIVTIMVDDREPTPDLNGEVVELPHTYAGNTYQYAYIPHYISRVYFDGKSCVNTTVIPVKIEGIFQLTTIEDIFELYSDNIIKDGDIETADLSKCDIKILSHNYDTGKSGFYKPQYIMRHFVDEDLYIVKDSDAGIPIVTKDHSLLSNGEIVKPLDLEESFDLDIVEEYPTAGSSGITYSGGDGLRITELDIVNLLIEPKRNVSILVDDDKIEYLFEYMNTDEKKGWEKGAVWKRLVYPRKIPLDEDFGLLCGLYLAEGCAGGSFLYTGTDWKLAEKVHRRAEKIFGKDNIMTQSRLVKETDTVGEHMDYTVRFSNQQGIGIFERLFGHNAENKQLPDDILTYSTKFIKGLLRGYFLGDGNLDGFDWYLRSGGFATKSRKLASQIVFLLKYKFGAENFRFKYGDNAYVVFWNKDKDERNKHKMKDSLITIPYKGYVYDFEVSKTGNFVDALGGVILHNTFREIYINQEGTTPTDASDFYWFNVMKQAKNRFRLFPRQDGGIQLVTRPWAEDPKDATKYHKVQMDYFDLIDLGVDPYDKNIVVSFRKEPVTSGDCYDEQTDILTNVGWKLFKDLNPEDKVASIGDGGNIVFVKPTRYIEEDYLGDMIRFNNRPIDLLVTPNHKMYVDYPEYDGNGNSSFKGNYRLVEAKDMVNDYVQLKFTGNWNGEEIGTFTLGETQRGFGKWKVPHFYPTREFDMDVWMEFIGYYLTEGWIGKQSLFIGIAQTNIKNREKIKICLLKLGVPFIMTKRDFQIRNYQLAQYLKQFGKAPNKFIPRNLFESSRRQLKILYDALMLGDGNKNGKRFNTVSERLANDFQELCLRVGYSAKIVKNSARIGDAVVINGKITGYNREPYYRVHIRRKWGVTNNKRGAADTINSREHYKGKIYCVEVPTDSHVVYVRRNGKPVWSGNSIQTHPVDVDFSGKYRSTIGMNPQVALKATIDYDGDAVAVFVPAIPDAVSYFDKDDDAAVAAVKKMKFDEKFVDLYDKAKKYKYGKDEVELGVKSSRYNQETAETENELIERLGGLRKRSLILQGKMEPVTVTIGVGSGLEEDHVLDMQTINRVTDVEKILKMREPRWLLKKLQKKPWGELTDDERNIVRDYHIRRQLRKVVDNAVRDPGVRKLYDLLKQPSEYMKEEFMSKAGESDPIGMKLDTKNRLLDRILWNEIRMADIYTDLDE